MNFAFSNEIYEMPLYIHPPFVLICIHLHVNVIDLFVNVYYGIAQTASSYKSSMYMYMHLYDDYASLDGPCVTEHIEHARNNFLCH